MLYLLKNRSSTIYESSQNYDSDKISRKLRTIQQHITLKSNTLNYLIFSPRRVNYLTYFAKFEHFLETYDPQTTSCPRGYLRNFRNGLKIVVFFDMVFSLLPPCYCQMTCDSQLPPCYCQKIREPEVNQYTEKLLGNNDYNDCPISRSWHSEGQPGLGPEVGEGFNSTVLFLSTTSCSKTAVSEYSLATLSWASPVYNSLNLYHS